LFYTLAGDVFAQDFYPVFEVYGPALERLAFRLPALPYVFDQVLRTTANLGVDLRSPDLSLELPRVCRGCASR
jgi:hypothetical protein